MTEQSITPQITSSLRLKTMSIIKHDMKDKTSSRTSYTNYIKTKTKFHDDLKRGIEKM
jgi:hypothetical protein